jgi:hypothetical protein
VTSVLFDGPGVVSCVRRGDADVEGEKKRVWWCQRKRGRSKTVREVERRRGVGDWLRRLMCGRGGKFMQCLR